MVLEPALRNDLVELIAANFKTDEVNELGTLLLGSFDSNAVLGTKNHISLSARKSARTLVDLCEQSAQIPSLLKLVVEVDDTVVHGRSVKVDGLEGFLGKLLRAGIRYDFKTRRIITACKEPGELANWGCLRDGREYDVSVMSLDIEGNSALVRKYGIKRMEKVYYQLWGFLREKLTAVDGRVWSWAGDGGLIAFALKDHTRRAARFAVEVQSTMPLFNLTVEGSPADIALRIGLAGGRVKFKSDTGKIVSDVINHAAHLEKKGTRPGCVSVSRSIYHALPSRLGSLFHYGGVFEDQDFYTTLRRLDGLLLDDASESEERFA